MMTLTHLAISGLMTSLILGTADPTIVSAGAIAGLLPDVDISKSPAGRVLSPKITTKIESVTWVDEEILSRLEQTIDRYPDAVMQLTGSIEIDDPDEITVRADPQQLTTVTKQGGKLAFNSCPLTNAIGLLRDQWGSGQVRIRVVINN